jgi:hypothetical protein
MQVVMALALCEQDFRGDFFSSLTQLIAETQRSVQRTIGEPSGQELEAF